MTTVMTADTATSDNEAEDADFYAARLAGLNQEHAVVTTDDIVNSKGIVLVRKGARIDADMAERILRHKLIKPLDQQVAVTDGLDGVHLAERFIQLHATCPDLDRLRAFGEFYDLECMDDRCGALAALAERLQASLEAAR
jgi:hypothetical protein